jgi:ABC-2 type transport system ATP-binding protein
MNAINVSDICKSYSDGKARITALSRVSFNVAKGELFGLIGPDGAGKTSLFRILTTLLLADEGSAEVDGFDVVKDYKEIRKRTGYMPGRFSLYQDLTVSENLDFFASIFETSIEENYDLIKNIYIQIEPFKDRRAGKLSGGMKQKLALCCALIHKPSVLFLDEPTTGVDAVSRKEFWDMLQNLKAQQITILVSTPYMDEASLCDRVALIQEGKILSVNTPGGITADFKNKLLAVRSERMYALLLQLKQMEGIKDAYPFGEYHHVVYDGDETAVRESIKRLGFTQLEMHNADPVIEDCFMELMKT